MDYKIAIEVLKRRESQVHEKTMKEALQLAIKSLEKDAEKNTLSHIHDYSESDMD